MQFKNYKVFAKYPIRWYTEFREVYGYSSNYSEGFDILVAPDTDKLWDSPNWRLKQLLECLVVNELYEPTLDICHEALSVYEAKEEEDLLSVSRVMLSHKHP